MLTKYTNYIVFPWEKKKSNLHHLKTRKQGITYRTLLAQENVFTSKHALLNLIQWIYKGMVVAEAKGQDEYQILSFKHASEVFVSEI